MKSIGLDNDIHDETVVKLSLKKDIPKIEVVMEPDDESNYTPEERVTYQKIKRLCEKQVWCECAYKLYCTG